jgi:CubicO group peptidase (beta-lactamase class C family)
MVGTSTNLRVVGPESVGVDPERLDVLQRRVRVDVERGPLPSAQVAVARDGELVLFETFGAAAAETRFILQSAGRSVVASVLWKLIGDGLLTAGDRVADLIPAFGTNGKDTITVEHIATHTAGLAFAPLGYPRMLDREERLRSFSRWVTTDPPGTVLQFHLTSSAWVIAELTETVTGSPFADYLHREIAEPLGLSIELGVSPERRATTVAPMVLIDAEDAEVDPWGAWYLNDPEVLAAGEPSHSIVGTAADVALHLQGLLHSGLWSRETVDECTRIRVTQSPAGEQVYGGSPEIVNVGMFVLVRGAAGGMTPTSGSAATFGHIGAPCSQGFLDPVSGVSFGFVTNGYPPTGYDYSPAGIARTVNIGNLALDVLDRSIRTS